MNFHKVIASSIVGISAMTLFSYALSETKNKQFREPEILASLVIRLFPETNNQSSKIAGWMMHYSVGLLFCSIYDKVWRKRQTPTVSSALLLGGICGLLGIGVWKSVLHIHPDPPKIDRGQFYKQLLPAHLIFGVFSAAGYRLGDKAKKIAVSKTEDPN